MKKYSGPARPIPTKIEIVSDKAERVIFLLLAIVAALLVYFGE